MDRQPLGYWWEPQVVTVNVVVFTVVTMLTILTAIIIIIIAIIIINLKMANYTPRNLK